MVALTTTSKIRPYVQLYVTELLERMREIKIENTWMPDVPARVVYTAPGTEVAWDTCPNGLVYGQVRSIAGPDLGLLNADGKPCVENPFEVSISLGIVRCVATIHSNGAAPAATAVDFDGNVTLLDMEAIIATMSCNPLTKRIEDCFTAGPEGGAAAVEGHLIVDLERCWTCP